MATAAPAVPAGTLADALTDAVARAKGGDRMAPVTVVTPSRHAATWAMRAALSGAAAHGGGGVANARVTTPRDLVVALAGPALAARGLRPARGSTGRALARVEGAAGPGRARLLEHGLADETLQQEQAVDAAVRGELPADLGQLVLMELGALAPGESELVQALHRRLGGQVVTAGPAPPCTELRPCASPSDEVRAAVRAVLSSLEAGVALWRQAILHAPGAAPGRMVHDELAAAGLPGCGPSVRRLADTAPGRMITGLLSLYGGDLPRDAVMAWVASSPLVTAAGDPVPAPRWDALSSAAGVVRGAAQWHDRLERLADAEEAWRPELHDLQRFVEELSGALTAPAEPSWAAWAGWAGALLRRYAGASPSEGWPADERLAVVQVGEVLGDMTELDAVAEEPGFEAFAATLRAELAHRRLDTGALGPCGFGRGVFVAPYGTVRAMQFDAVVLLGVSDVDDSSLRTALCAGTRRRMGTWVTDTPSAGPRTGFPTVPGPCLGDDTLLAPFTSFSAGLLQAGPPLQRHDLALRALARHRRRGRDVAESAVVRADRRLTSGLEARRARRGQDFTRYDGRTGTGLVSPFDPDRPLSPTRLETFAECPRRFLFDRVLAVRARPRPETLWRIEARLRGSLVHEILERYVRARLEGAERSLALLLGLAADVLDEAGAGGHVGKPLLWRLERDAIERDLRVFHAEEGERQPLAAEFAFGTDESDAAPPVGVELSDGRVVRFGGRADRVELAADGTLVVSDYKTGRQAGLARLTADPLDAGRRLQLPVYALAARHHFDPSAPVRARYWMVSAERDTATYEVELTAELDTYFRDTVGRLALAVDAGAFPGTPGMVRGDGFERCWGCDFDGVCSPRRDREWSAKRADPALTPLARVTDRVVPDELSGAVVRGDRP